MTIGAVLAILAVGAILAWSTILTWSAVHAILSVLTMIDGHFTALGKHDHVSDFLSAFKDWSDARDIVIVLKSIYDGSESLDIGIQLIYLSLEGLESIPCRQFDLGSVCQGNDDVRRIRGTVYILEKRISLVAFVSFISLRTLLTLRTLRACLALISGCLTKIFPCLATIYRYVPLTILDLQLWSNSILARFALWTLRTCLTLRTLRTLWSCFSLRTLWAGFTLRALWTCLSLRTLWACSTIHTNCLYLVAVPVSEPLSVESPVIDSIRILPHTDLRCVAILSVCAVGTIRTVSTILAMIDSDGSALVESDPIAYFLTVLNNRHNSCDIILCLKCKNHGLQRLDIGIGLVTERIQALIDFVDLLMDLRKLIPIDILAAHKQQTSQEDNVKNLLHKNG